MARSHGRFYSSAWGDDDFLDLSGDAQRVYFLLLSQQNLSHCGLLPLTVKRWANMCRDWPVARMEAALAELEVTEYIVIDDTTEELLVRSLIRRDEVYKQPNVLAAAVADASAIASHRLRAVLLTEVHRVAQLEGLIERSATLLATLAGTLRRTLPGTPSEGQTEKPSGATGMGRTTVVTNVSSPTTSPAPATVPALRDEPPDDPTGVLLAEHVAAYAEPVPPSAMIPVKREIMRLVAERVPPDRIRAGLARLREKRLAASLLPQLVTECGPSPSTTDQRVAQGLALVRRYEQAEQ